MPRITIATSIAPRNLALQRAAVDSWQRLGFVVISVNSAEEVPLLAGHFPDVAIHTVERTAHSTAGKPYVFFDDVRSALLASDAEVCGIVNSDVFLLAGAGFPAFIADHAHDGMVFGSRIDVDSLDDLDGEPFVFGFDFFFLDRRVLAAYPPSDFCLGIPWWDYWAPLVPLARGDRCVELISPVAFHVKHEQKWRGDLYVDFGLHFAGQLAGIDGQGTLAALGTKSGSLEAVTTMSFDVLSHLLRNTGKIAWPGADDPGAVVPLGRRQYLSVREQLIAQHRESASLRERLPAPAEEARLRDELSRVYGSLSWRITRPLRWLRALTRRRPVPAR